MRPPHALAFLLTLALAPAACTSSSNFLEPDPDEPVEEVAPPTVRTVAPSDLPAFDTERFKATCQTSSGACPVVRWKDVDYVALSYRDNRSSFAIHAFDAAGGTVGVAEALGARYVNDARVDVDGRTVTFVGQADRAVTFGWDDLAAIR